MREVWLLNNNMMNFIMLLFIRWVFATRHASLFMLPLLDAGDDILSGF